MTTEAFEADLRQALARGAADVPETTVDRVREAVLEESDDRLTGWERRGAVHPGC